MIYFQCNKCKKLIKLPGSYFDGQILYKIGTEELILNIVKPEFVEETICKEHLRRMRELTKDEYELNLSP